MEDRSPDALLQEEQLAVLRQRPERIIDHRLECVTRFTQTTQGRNHLVAERRRVLADAALMMLAMIKATRDFIDGG